jgi:hypothetical protein
MKRETHEREDKVNDKPTAEHVHNWVARKGWVGQHCTICKRRRETPLSPIRDDKEAK